MKQRTKLGLALEKIERLDRYLETAKRELKAVDKALPQWEGTGRGRIETIERLTAALGREANRVWYPNSYTHFKALVRDGAREALEVSDDGG